MKGMLIALIWPSKIVYVYQYFTLCLIDKMFTCQSKIIKTEKEDLLLHNIQLTKTFTLYHDKIIDQFCQCEKIEI